MQFWPYDDARDLPGYATTLPSSTVFQSTRRSNRSLPFSHH